MKNFKRYLNSERGSAGIKFLAIIVVLVLVFNAGYNYIPIAYEGANLRQEMDTAVVRGMATSGRLKPMDVVKASLEKAMRENNVPADAVVEIQPTDGVIHAFVAYTKPVSMLPFGLYKYQYNFSYRASPAGFIMKDAKG